MRWDLNNNGGGGMNFQKGKRYTLVIADARDEESKEKLTPYLHLIFKTEAGEDAFDKKLWNTDKAAYRMIEWALAMGFKCEGDVDLNPENMIGIRLTAECGATKPDDQGKTYTDWINPLPVKAGTPPAPAAAAATASRQEEVNDDVPF